MKVVTTSTAAIAAVGLVFGVGASALACDFHAQQVTAAVAPTPSTNNASVSATTVDPVYLAGLEKAAILPAAPKEEKIEDVEAN
ncbi:MAG: hypothetical protein F9K43_06970 [Bauldia sp.]|nr:MAG: hypothetical protein F9K43_06970 [Bauldia sp.]